MTHKIDWTGTEDMIKQLSFPLASDAHESYYKALEEVFISYKSLVKILIENNKTLDNLLIELIVKNCQVILDCISLYHEGKAGISYHNLNEILIDLSKSVLLDSLENQSHLFRMRVSTENIRNTEDIFHIPFDKRHLVDSQRYSIAGLPCLYLGSSNFISWYELNKPDFHSLYTSSFKLTQKINFLDISNDLSFIKDFVSQTELTNSLKFYPISLACNFSTKYFHAKFNDEYIIPNLLLQWVLNSDEYNGIKYLSVKYYNNSYRNKLLNYVLPPKDTSGQKYCKELSRMFIISKPASFAVLMHGPNLGEVEAFQTIQGTDAESALLKIYDRTVFWRTEEIAKNLPHSILGSI